MPDMPDFRLLDSWRPVGQGRGLNRLTRSISALPRTSLLPKFSGRWWAIGSSIRKHVTDLARCISVNAIDAIQVGILGCVLCFVSKGFGLAPGM